jgi:hypothetical protein
MSITVPYYHGRPQTTIIGVGFGVHPEGRKSWKPLGSECATLATSCSATRADDDGKHLTQTPLAPPGPTAMPLLRANILFLLALPLRIRNLPDLHAGEHLGHVLQSYHMGLPGLRAAQRIRKSMSSSNSATTFIIENSYGRFADLVGRMRLNVAMNSAGPY